MLNPTKLLMKLLCTYFGSECYKVFGLKFSLYLEGSRLFRFKGLNLLDKEKISVPKLYNTANQNNSVINSYKGIIVNRTLLFSP